MLVGDDGWCSSPTNIPQLDGETPIHCIDEEPHSELTAVPEPEYLSKDYQRINRALTD